MSRSNRWRGYHEPRWLADDIALATYQLADTRRSSIWQRANGRWRLVFHQGTRVA